MMLGLNKDLERALRDKDRYRRKLKDQLALVQSIHAAGLPEQAPHVDLVHSAHPAGIKEDESVISNDSALRSSLVLDSDNPPTDTSTATADTAIETGPLDDSTIDRAPRITSWLSSGEGSGDGSSPMKSPDKDKPFESQPRSGESLKTLPMVGVAERLRAERLRKLAPTPMDLAKSALNASHPPPDDDSTSEYEEELRMDGDARPAGRGRRRQREDDSSTTKLNSLGEDVQHRPQHVIQSSSPRLSTEAKARHERSHAVGGDVRRDIRMTASVPRPASLLSTASLQQAPAGYDPPIHTSASLPRLAHRLSQQFFQSSKGSALPSSPRPIDRPPNSPLPRVSVARTFSDPGYDLDSGATTPIAQRIAVVALKDSPPLTANGTHPEEHDRLSSLPRSPALASQASSSALGGASKSSASGSMEALVFKGFMTEQYPGLLLPPMYLPRIEVRVNSSRLRPARGSAIGLKQNEEESAFLLAIHLRMNGSQLWRLEKSLISMIGLDQQLKMASTFNARLPDKNLFGGHAPAKVDLRRAAILQYFTAMLDTPMNERAALVVCEYLSSDVVEPQVNTSTSDSDSAVALAGIQAGKRTKEGYLAKKGKQWGGWKSRYFVLESSELHYYEAPGGQHLGYIKLRSSHITKQFTTRRDDSDDSEFRHGLVILEPKRKDVSNIRHVLCAESDEDRDDWIEALSQHVDGGPDEHSRPPSKTPSNASRKLTGARTPEPQATAHVHAVGYTDTVAAEAPTVDSISWKETPTLTQDGEASGSSRLSSTTSAHHLVISNPIPTAITPNIEGWSGRTGIVPQNKEKETKKRSIFGFRRATLDSNSAPPNTRSNPTLGAITSQKDRSSSRTVFGANLAEAAEFSPPADVDICLPSPVYRCIEYLEARNAASEEGIFRLSGSSLVIKSLRERFNNEGDVKLVDEQYYDIHVVASLLKLYLRELPASVLTRELNLEFMRTLGGQSRNPSNSTTLTRLCRHAGSAATDRDFERAGTQIARSELRASCHSLTILD